MLFRICIVSFLVAVSSVAPIVGQEIPLAPREVASLNSLLDLAKAAIQPDATPESVAAGLIALGLNPLTATEHTEERGGLSIVRTTDSLVGTRYVHFQFDTESGEQGATNVLFDLRPAPDAWAVGRSLIQSKFPQAEVYQDDGPTQFIGWRLGTCRIVWLGRLTVEDISTGNPHNVYSPDDEGTIRVAVEVGPHC